MASPKKNVPQKSLSRLPSGAGVLRGPGFTERTLTRERAAVLASLLALTLLYAGLSAYLNGFHAFWSGDSGARFAMIQNWAQHGRLTGLAYDGALDPAGRLHALQFYVVHGPKGLAVMYPPLFAWVSGQAFRALGFGGLTLVPLLCGVLTLGVTYRTAARLGLRCRALLPLVVGIATPVLIYSVVFWDHTLLMLLTACTGYSLLRALGGGGRLFVVAAGVLLGAGIWVHVLFFFLVFSLLATSWPARGALERAVGGWGRLALLLCLPFAVSVLLWLVANHQFYGLWGGAHLAANTGGTLDAGDHAEGLRAALNPQAFLARAALQLVDAPPGRAWGWVLGAALVALPLAARLRPGPRFLVPLLYTAAAVAAGFLLRAFVPRSGLFAVTPLLAPSLGLIFGAGQTAADTPVALYAVRPADAPPATKESPHMSAPHIPAFYAWMGRACALFIFLVLLNPVTPGMDWGSRYLLTVLPLLVLLAAAALESQVLRSGRAGRSLLLAATVVLVGVSGASQCCGLAAVRADLAYSRALNRAAGTLDPFANSSALVTDVVWLGPELAASASRDPRLLVRSAGDRRLLLSALDRAPGFTFMGTDAGCAALAADAARGVFPSGSAFRPVASWPEAGLRLARFERRPAGRPARRVLALYYPWYGTPKGSGKWAHQDGVNLTAKQMADHAHFPALGPYDSADPAVIERHLTQAHEAGIDALVCSWWGRGDRTDAVTRLVLRRAAAHSLKVCVLWERLSAPRGAQALSDLTYLLNTLAKNPSYLREGGRPVIFLHTGASQALRPDEWAAVAGRAATQMPPGALLIGVGRSPAEMALWDGFYALSTDRTMFGADLAECARVQAETYRPLVALAARSGRISVESVLPGYDARRPAPPGGRPAGMIVGRRAGGLYRALWEQALQDSPDWILVNSFNQWHNGTEIEPSVEMGGRYLALTRQYAQRFKSGSPTPAGPTPAGPTPAVPPVGDGRKAVQ